MTGGAFPSGISGSSSGDLYTISGTPTAAGAFNYSLTASANGCTSADAVGTIMVVYDFTTSTGGPNTAYTNTTWMIGTGSSAQTWSDGIALAVADCYEVTSFVNSGANSYYYKEVNGRYYYTWACAYTNMAALCPSAGGWRFPSKNDFETLLANCGPDPGSLLWGAWGPHGCIVDSTPGNSLSYLWSTTEMDGTLGGIKTRAHSLYYTEYYWYTTELSKGYGVQVRCVK
jgi:hypothetical protein